MRRTLRNETLLPVPSKRPVDSDSFTMGILFPAWFVGSIIVGFAGLNRKGGYLQAFLLALFLTPIVGLILTIGGAHANARGCAHSGNEDNEADYCALCGLNEAGESRS